MRINALTIAGILSAMDYLEHGRKTTRFGIDEETIGWADEMPTRVKATSTPEEQATPVEPVKMSRQVRRQLERKAKR